MLLLSEQTSESLGPCPLLCKHHRLDWQSPFPLMCYEPALAPKARATLVPLVKEALGQASCFTAWACLTQSLHPSLQMHSKAWASPEFRLERELPCLWWVASKLSLHTWASHWYLRMWWLSFLLFCRSILSHLTDTYNSGPFILTWLCSEHFIRRSPIKTQWTKIWWSL